MKVLLALLLGTFLIVLWMTNRGRSATRAWPLVVLSLLVGVVFFVSRGVI